MLERLINEGRLELGNKTIVLLEQKESDFSIREIISVIGKKRNVENFELNKDELNEFLINAKTAYDLPFDNYWNDKSLVKKETESDRLDRVIDNLSEDDLNMALEILSRVKGA